ncbi:hypothetical protein M513_11652 [Trichuris suis]|uniref:Uncharacterized protein n=1 Tax=Trichuris suis TaxID=68888 RepID=A0A085LR95_9BILA|nr:hypothetical protein M513_11652 [Trichuris suis]
MEQKGNGFRGASGDEKGSIISRCEWRADGIVSEEYMRTSLQMSGNKPLSRFRNASWGWAHRIEKKIFNWSVCADGSSREASAKNTPGSRNGAPKTSSAGAWRRSSFTVL